MATLTHPTTGKVDSYDLVQKYAPRVLAHPDWNEIPNDMGDALLDYLSHGHPMGDFLEAVVTGDLHWAAARADLDNFERLCYFGRWILQSWPTESYGSREKLDAWYGHRGLLRTNQNLCACGNYFRDTCDACSGSDDGVVRGLLTSFSPLLTDAQTLVFEEVVQRSGGAHKPTHLLPVECEGTSLDAARELAGLYLLHCVQSSGRAFVPTSAGIARYAAQHGPDDNDDDAGADDVEPCPDCGKPESSRQLAIYKVCGRCLSDGD